MDGNEFSVRFAEADLKRALEDEWDAIEEQFAGPIEAAYQQYGASSGRRG